MRPRLRKFSLAVFILVTVFDVVFGTDFLGCKYDSSLCEPAEVCIDDAVFGRCQQKEPFDDYQYALKPEEKELLRLELTRLALKGKDWNNDRVQCVLRYFLLTHRHGLLYNQQFCNVNNVDSMLDGLQGVENNLAIDMQSEDVAGATGDGSLEAVDQDLMNNDEQNEDSPLPISSRSVPMESVDDDVAPMADDGSDMSAEEEHLLNGYIFQMLNGETPDFSKLTPEQLDRFITYVESVKAVINARPGYTQGEVALEEPQGDEDLEKFLYKKDEEKLGIMNQGTGDKEHRIQTREPRYFAATPSPQKGNQLGPNRVYLKLKQNIVDLGTAFKFLENLEEKVGDKHNVTFSDVRIQNDTISFKVESDETPNVPAIVDFQVAADTYAMAKKSPLAVQDQMDVQETGVMNSAKTYPVDFDNDGFVVPTLIVCGLVVGSLVVVLGIYVYKSRSRAKESLKRFAADLEGPPGKDYEELCRQRMSAKTEGPAPLSGIVGTLATRLSSQSEPSPPAVQPHSARSSTSSWSEEPVQTNMDISTGHMILSYMEDHLFNKDRLEQEWRELEAYQPDTTAAYTARELQNQSKNRCADVVPYDHNRVTLNAVSNHRGSDYVNASFIYDHDPRNPAYIACQAPLADTVSDFWQMIWEQGSVVIVNMTKLMESGDQKCHRYWPENGSEVHQDYEIHLVSEHIWCEDYVVRSFYLKNLRTQETRTVTQFHFLSWPDNGTPASSKALLEFRRKVNKSFRGRSCPIVVHCSDGSGRTGTYCLLDMVLNRISKGVKEIDIAAALEHLRDQRVKFIHTMEQFEFVLASVAEEVQAVLKALPQQ